MKIIYLSIALAFFSLNSQAQNQNVKAVTKTSVTTFKDSEGEKKLIVTEEVKEVQNIELKDADSKELNKEMRVTPVEVISTTTITAPDGTKRVVDVDRSAYYRLNGKKYQVAVDNTGYTLSADNKKMGVLRQLSNNSYIYRTKNKTSLGYFDANGNLVLETYDDKTDKISVEIFTKN